MSGIYGICEPGCELPVTTLWPMLEVTRPPEYQEPKVDTSRGALLGVTPRSRMRTTATLDGLCMALDADFHNYKELANSLEGFPSVDIAGVVMRLYQKYGFGFVQWLEGPFSLALWDAAKQRLILAIDRMGIRSLYWRREKTRLLFASHLRAIRAVQHEPPRVDPFAVMQFFIFAAVPAPLSIDNGSQKIAPGHLLVFEKDQLKAIRYWDLHYKEEDARKATAWAEDLRDTLGSAIHRHLADCDSTHLGCFLSGGTDSSTVVALASERISPLRTFSICFREPEYSEIQFVRTISDRFQTRSFEECLIPATAYESIPAIVAAFDEPFANSSALATYACAKLARGNGVNVLLAADGGDELFAGNQHYLREKYLDIYDRVPRSLRAGFLEPLAYFLPRNGRVGFPRRYICRAAVPNPQRFLSYKYFLNISPEIVFDADFLKMAPADTWLQIPAWHFKSADATNDLNRMLYLDMKMTLADNDLRKVVGTAEACGVQVRFPLLDYHLAELSARIPARLKLRGSQLRYIFKCAMKPLLPRFVLFKKKHGFGVPIGLWLRNDACFKAQIQDLLSDRNLILREYFQSQFLKSLLGQHTTARDPEFHGKILWRLMIFELWHRQQYSAMSRY